MKFGLIGKSLEHSFSKKYFESKFLNLELDYQYENIEVESSIDLNTHFSTLREHYNGLNVTIPYKKEVIHQLDDIGHHAQKIGAVNTIVFRDGNAVGYNTDYQGFYESVYKKSFPRDRKVLILGNGGASLAVKYAVETLLKMDFEIVARKKGDIDWKDIQSIDLSHYSLIVNTTPMGMFPNVDDCPNLNYKSANQDTLFVDLIYNPVITEFLLKADARGCTILNGLPMLHKQADLAWDLWSH